MKTKKKKNKNKPSTFGMHAEASGRCARQVFRSRLSCPYAEDSEKRAIWLKAWDDEDSKQVGIEMGRSPNPIGDAILAVLPVLNIME